VAEPSAGFAALFCYRLGRTSVRDFFRLCRDVGRLVAWVLLSSFRFGRCFLPPSIRFWIFFFFFYFFFGIYDALPALENPGFVYPLPLRFYTLSPQALTPPFSAGRILFFLCCTLSFLWILGGLFMPVASVCARLVFPPCLVFSCGCLRLGDTRWACAKRRFRPFRHLPPCLGSPIARRSKVFSDGCSSLLRGFIPLSLVDFFPWALPRDPGCLRSRFFLGFANFFFLRWLPPGFLFVSSFGGRLRS